jgi:DNA-binding SARP family transcriptional activator
MQLVPTDIAVCTATGEVRRNGEPVPLRDREREIVVAIAVQPDPISVERLGELLFPDRDPANSANTVKVTVCRLRRRLGDDVIVHRQRGYALGPRATSDLAQARTFLLRHAAHGAGVSPRERERILVLARNLRREPLPGLSRCAWHEAVARFAQRAGRDIAMLLARRAIDSRELQAAVGIARELTYEDACDEEAWELLIRAQLELGERVAARHGFRILATALAKDLELLPSPSIRRLVEVHCGAVAI